MPDFVQVTHADASGNATLDLLQIPSGREWIIQQVGVFTIPVGNNVVANIFRNGQLIASSNQGSAGSAGGQPYYRISDSDKFSVKWIGAPALCQCNVTISYTEHQAGTADATNTGIV